MPFSSLYQDVITVIIRSHSALVGVITTFLCNYSIGFNSCIADLNLYNAMCEINKLINFRLMVYLCICGRFFNIYLCAAKLLVF